MPCLLFQLPLVCITGGWDSHSQCRAPCKCRQCLIFEHWSLGTHREGGGTVILRLFVANVFYEFLHKYFFRFNFASFLGAVTAGFPGSLTAFLGLFGPGFILIFAMLPFWSRFRHLLWFKAVLKGLNASAVGLIAAGCVTLYPKSVTTFADTMVFVLCSGLAVVYNVQAPLVILGGCGFGALFSRAVLNVGQKHLYEAI